MQLKPYSSNCSKFGASCMQQGRQVNPCQGMQNRLLNKRFDCQMSCTVYLFRQTIVSGIFRYSRRQVCAIAQKKAQHTNDPDVTLHIRGVCGVATPRSKISMSFASTLSTRQPPRCILLQRADSNLLDCIPRMMQYLSDISGFVDPDCVIQVMSRI